MVGSVFFLLVVVLFVLVYYPGVGDSEGDSEVP